MRNFLTTHDFDFTPFYVLNEVERDMKRMLDMMNTNRNDWLAHNNLGRSSYQMKDSESHLFLSFDLPGVKKDDINLEIRDGQLFLKAHRESGLSDNKETHTRFGEIQRVLTLPQGIEEDKIEARYENGVLSVALPKAEKSRPKQIAITEGGKEGIWSRLLGNTSKDRETSTGKVDSASNHVAA